MVCSAWMLAMTAAPAFAADLEANKKTVLEFYEAGLNRKDFDAASKYFGPKYIQHNPGAPDGIEGFKSFITFLQRKISDSRSGIKKTFAEGDYVILHVHAVREPGTRGRAALARSVATSGGQACGDQRRDRRSGRPAPDQLVGRFPRRRVGRSHRRARLRQATAERLLGARSPLPRRLCDRGRGVGGARQAGGKPRRRKRRLRFAGDDPRGRAGARIHRDRQLDGG